MGNIIHSNLAKSVDSTFAGTKGHMHQIYGIEFPSNVVSDLVDRLLPHICMWLKKTVVKRCECFPHYLFPT